MEIYLYKTGRNLNRSIRACHSFGISKLHLVNCNKSYLKGNLYSSQVQLINAQLPDNRNTLVIEKDGKIPLTKIDWSKINNIVIGGESVSVPLSLGQYSARIPTANSLCLTTEAAINIVLHESLIARLSKIKNFRHTSKNKMASGMPKATDIIYLAKNHGLQLVIDLTKRCRPSIKNACKKQDIEYFKIPIDEDFPNENQIKKAVECLSNNKIALVFCYRGIHRTGTVLNQFLGIPVVTKRFKNHQKLLALCHNSNNFAYAPIFKQV